MISGYLMCMILSKSPITIPEVKLFYFRRIKRIVPLYNTFIALTLFAPFLLGIAFTELGNIGIQAEVAAVFLSNMIGVQSSKGYFTSVSY